MAVSKIAVMALVAVIAIPILLGYAFNLDETTETGYRTTGDPVNVTPIIQNDVAYTYAHADIYQLNTFNIYNLGVKALPIYENKTTNKTPLFYRNIYTIAVENYDYKLWDYYNYGLIIFNSTSAQHLDVDLYWVDNADNKHFVATYSNVFVLSYDDSTKKIDLDYHVGTTRTHTTYTSDKILLNYTIVGGFIPNNNGYAYINSKTEDPNNYPGYVNLSAGYRLFDRSTTIENYGSINMPSNTRNAIMTINLDSITDPNYTFQLGSGHTHHILTKTTSGGEVTWTVAPSSDPTDTTVLYYDQSRSDNTYQYYVQTKTTGKDSTYYYYHTDIELRYVGGWPTLIGEANYYYKYSDSADTGSYLIYGETGLQQFDIRAVEKTTPIVRMDDAEFRAFEYNAIVDKVYNPASFRSNPSTTITDLNVYGTSIEFGGNTYTVTDGKITIDGHKIPINGLILSSKPNPGGGYDNMIGNTVISNTAGASSITFNGTWSASISTIAQESYTYTKTEWNAGSFGWDGVDQNFLMVGLITCLGVFVALGIYARKRGTGGLIPLMIVTGCAAAVFFIML